MPPPPSRRRTVFRWVAAGSLAAAAALVGAALAFLPSDQDIRRRLERVLSERFDASVTLAELHTSLLSGPSVNGAGLKLVPRTRPNAPPLIVVTRFSARAAWRDVLLRPRRVRSVVLEGLTITIAPKDGDSSVRSAERGGCRGDREQPRPRPAADARSSPVLIEHLSVPAAELVLLPRDAGKLPRRFSFSSLELRNITLDQPLDFEAVLTNPVPSGVIKTRGSFGPWAAGDPGRSPVRGDYRFEGANLGTINGIGGTLTSAGRYEGLLQQILVTGTSDTPDFSLDTADHPLPLHADFEACVDGTDGDTYLDAVRARLASTPIDVKGRIEGHVGVDGRTLALDATIDRGRIEDVLRLVVKGEEPVMRGGLSLSAAILLPPGAPRVAERLQVNGGFRLEGTHFTGRQVQAKIDELSRRALPGTEGAAVRNVASDFAGRFALAGGNLRLQNLAFTVPGARVALGGTYGLVTERIAMEGTARLQARPSEMTTGITSKLLKAADLLVSRRDAGTVLPIRISGTRAKPSFGVDYKGVLTRKVK